MSSRSTVSSPLETERRVHARRRMEGLAYVDLGPDNGAILIDLGEGGLSFHSVAPVTLDQAVLLKFKLPGAADFIESYAEVAWLNETGKGGGLRFVELRSELREQIGAWAGTVRAAEVGATTEVSKTEVGKTESSAAQVSSEGSTALRLPALTKPKRSMLPLKAKQPRRLNRPELRWNSRQNQLWRKWRQESPKMMRTLIMASPQVTAIEENVTEDVLPSVETSEERAIAAASAATLAANSEPVAPAHSDPITKKSAEHNSAVPLVGRSGRREEDRRACRRQAFSIGRQCAGESATAAGYAVGRSFQPRAFRHYGGGLGIFGSCVASGAIDGLSRRSRRSTRKRHGHAAAKRGCRYQRRRRATYSLGRVGHPGRVGRSPPSITGAQEQRVGSAGRRTATEHRGDPRVPSAQDRHRRGCRCNPGAGDRRRRAVTPNAGAGNHQCKINGDAVGSRHARISGGSRGCE